VHSNDVSLERSSALEGIGKWGIGEKNFRLFLLPTYFQIMQESDRNRSYYTQELQQRKTWYSSVADAYNKTRPRYPQAIVDRVVELSQLTPSSNILELGCGPGNATVSFAQKGFSMVCIEPAPGSFQLARKNCVSYPNVEIINISFEEWQLPNYKFDAVLAASSIHWISPDIVYAKVSQALSDRGFLILLWNIVSLYPPYEIYQTLQDLYQLHVPTLAKYEDKETQVEKVLELAQQAIDSGKFKNFVSDRIDCEVTYSADDYLTFLSTLSPYIALDRSSRKSLFSGLKEKIQENLGGTIKITYPSVFHVAQKV
jgi:SAM-dependent methyltransferase